MPQQLIPIILAGGKGERFWPLSRRQRPKQFLSLDGSGLSLLQATAERLLAIAQGWDNLWVITASHLAAGVAAQLPQIPSRNILIEPEGRDTAPAVTWATLEVAQTYGDQVALGFFPADHWIDDLDVFNQTLQAATDLATQQQAIVTLGIQPRYPATGYGYIEQGEPVGTFVGQSAYRVNRFTEKPDLSTAEDFVASGRFSWNGGIFVFQAATALTELQTYAPELLSALQEQGVEAYSTLEKISIDYALMEKTQKACVLPVNFAWDDLGDWNALERLQVQDSDPGTTNVEVGNHIGLDSQKCIVHAGDEAELVVTLGVEDLVIVRDGNATLIAHKSRTQDIKKVLKQLQAEPRYTGLL
ncbi:MAG: mannose-1-phosphate guanylyltransferase [Cyanobacteria bacterium P01_H01_bin.121]